MSIFGKDKKENKKKIKTPEKDAEVKVEEAEVKEIKIAGEKSSSAYRVLKGFYVSEKASNLHVFDQYVFRVDDGANKSEIAKHVAKLFDVKVKAVKIVKLPSKVRNIGRHTGIKPGYKKAIVILEKGYSIQQARP